MAFRAKGLLFTVKLTEITSSLGGLRPFLKCMLIFYEVMGCSGLVE